jgi:hypothetical protein
VSKIISILLVAFMTSCSSESNFDLSIQKFKQSFSENDVNHDEYYYIHEFLKYFPEAKVYHNISGTNTVDIYCRNKNGILNPITNQKIRLHIEMNDKNVSKKIKIYSYVEVSGKTLKPDAIYYK